MNYDRNVQNTDQFFSFLFTVPLSRESAYCARAVQCTSQLRMELFRHIVEII